MLKLCEKKRLLASFLPQFRQISIGWEYFQCYLDMPSMMLCQVGIPASPLTKQLQNLVDAEVCASYQVSAEFADNSSLWYKVG